jgi:hypothetical protein
MSQLSAKLVVHPAHNWLTRWKVTFWFRPRILASAPWGKATNRQISVLG